MTTDAGRPSLALAASVATTDAVLRALAAVRSRRDLANLMEAITRELGFRYYALIHHDDLRGAPADSVNIKDYPTAATERIVEDAAWRRDPVMRSCVYAEHAFRWSELGDIIQLNRRDHISLELGAREGLNEGITVPCATLGQRLGSCTFAGTRSPEDVGRFVGMAQMVGIFAFQAAKRGLTGSRIGPAPRLRLHPRPRDCVVLAGRGHSNKEIARALGLTPRTVDGYLTNARRLFGTHDRTELVVAALLAGEIDLAEIRTRQPA